MLHQNRTLTRHWLDATQDNRQCSNNIARTQLQVERDSFWSMVTKKMQVALPVHPSRLRQRILFSFPMFAFSTRDPCKFLSMATINKNSLSRTFHPIQGSRRQISSGNQSPCANYFSDVSFGCLSSAFADFENGLMIFTFAFCFSASM